MARPYPPSTRATDTDRSAVLALLDAAFTDGQFDAAEHDLRADLLADARTLGDLAALVEDLQDATPPRPTTSVRASSGPAGPATRARRFLVGTLVAAAAAAIAAFWFVGREEPPAVAAPAEATTAPDVAALPARVVATPDLRTAEGFAQFVEDYRAKFGDTVVDDLTIWDEYAMFTRAMPQQPNREVEYSYRYGFAPRYDPTTRSLDTPTVDLAAVDQTALARLLAEAVPMLNVPGGEITHISVDPPGRYGPASVRIFVGNDFSESGNLEASLAGEILDVSPYGQ
ncbi:DUF1707 SHOCT-like domain-containing protein [Rhodococcus gannanensis]|uniref:DUF1707 domain-containing protein n=1 Tax=Rhodococcus gannanensis TaxID=1960308 RepID=A0ABW4P1V7_9NOCA